LRLAHNPGIAFGLLDDAPGAAVILLVAAITAALAVAAWRGLLAPLPAGLILGGALANLLDRMHGRTVVDLLHTGWWPTFNLADVFICAGAAFLVLTDLRRPAGDEETTSARAPQAASHERQG
ncbi:MAG TPA: signal peptidase II, partial [Acidimicrobiales bacterium]